ncbi:MAG: MetQ/NlpA family ABC transporter substrate-binding protein, partial [Lacticaseibacillus paracasei]|nr:MetQ/NlpA family ABC transporter substrate-binding protein [Lacticaseibacillus paracasei]
KKIVKAYQTQRTADLLKKVYKGSTLPAWNYKF